MLAAIVTIGSASAQTAAPVVAEDFKPSSLNQPGQQYPQVNSQGYVRFRVAAPDAQKVRVTLGLGGQGGTVLSKAADGAWTGTFSAQHDNPKKWIYDRIGAITLSATAAVPK